MVVASGVTGCVNGSLASSTGPRSAGRQWSTTRQQLVHVQETVYFDFVLTDRSNRLVPPLGVADYIVAYVGRERIESLPDVTGHFSFHHRFEHGQPGDRFKVTVSAFRQRRSRDFMKVQGQWLRNDSPFEEPDRIVASDSITLTLYEKMLEFHIDQPRDELQPKTGVLKIRRTDDQTTSIYLDQPHSRGFTITGPNAGGQYLVRYRPNGDELNATGTTTAEFVIYDTSGAPHHQSLEFETP